MKPENAGFNELESYFTAKNIQVVNIGDSWRARKILDGTHERRNILSRLERMGAFEEQTVREAVLV